MYLTQPILALEMSFFLSCMRSFLEFQKANKKEKKGKKINYILLIIISWDMLKFLQWLTPDPN